jgi:hypothetical protein
MGSERQNNRKQKKQIQSSESAFLFFSIPSESLGSGLLRDKNEFMSERSEFKFIPRASGKNR